MGGISARLARAHKLPERCAARVLDVLTRCCRGSRRNGEQRSRAERDSDLLHVSPSCSLAIAPCCRRLSKGSHQVPPRPRPKPPVRCARPCARGPQPRPEVLDHRGVAARRERQAALTPHDGTLLRTLRASSRRRIPEAWRISPSRSLTPLPTLAVPWPKFRRIPSG